MLSNKSIISQIDLGNLVIAATVESTSLKAVPYFFPANCLIKVISGKLKIQISEESYTIESGQYGLVRKFQESILSKTWDEPEDRFFDIVFALHDTFIQEIIEDIPYPENRTFDKNPVIKINTSEALEKLFDSMKSFINDEVSFKEDIIKQKTQEALIELISEKPDLIPIFKENCQPEKANLAQMMNSMFLQNFTLEKLAFLSGRSLSSFQRDFRNIFNTTPHKWIKKRRLEYAKLLLTESNRPAMDIFIDAGFEDLGHFSRSFKEHFGINPSQIRKQYQK